MKLIERIFALFCFISFLWALPWSPIAYINAKQFLYKDQYKLVEFKVEKLELTCGDGCTAIALGEVDGRTEKMGIGHFYLYESFLPEVLSAVLPVDAEKLFRKDAKIQVYYNPCLSNFTINSRTARFLSRERYQQLTFGKTLGMLTGIFGPLLLSLIGWFTFRTHIISADQLRR